MYNNNGYQHRQGNNYSYQPNNFRGGNYYQGNGPRGYNNNQQNRQQKKHSGAKLSPITKGTQQSGMCIVAWNYSRGKGLVKCLIVPYKGTKQHDSKTGKIWENWMVKINYTKTGQELTKSALVQVTPNGDVIKAFVNHMGWVVNPKAPNGG